VRQREFFYEYKIYTEKKESLQIIIDKIVYINM